MRRTDQICEGADKLRRYTHATHLQRADDRRDVMWSQSCCYGGMHEQFRRAAQWQSGEQGSAEAARLALIEQGESARFHCAGNRCCFAVVEREPSGAVNQALIDGSTRSAYFNARDEPRVDQIVKLLGIAMAVALTCFKLGDSVSRHDDTVRKRFDDLRRPPGGVQVDHDARIGDEDRRRASEES